MEENTLHPDEKRIPGFSRYAVNKAGEVRNILTDIKMVIDVENGYRFRLIDDQGKRVRLKVSEEMLAELFKPLVVEPLLDNFTRDLAEHPLTDKEIDKLVNEPFIATDVPHGIDNFDPGFYGVDLASEKDFTVVTKYTKQPDGTFVGEIIPEKPKGSKKMTTAVVLAVRRDYANKVPVKEIGEKYGISSEHARRTGKGQYPKVMPLE